MFRAFMLACLAWGVPAGAATFERCARPDVKVAGAAITGALELALHAAVAVEDGPEYVLWFGRFSVRNDEEVWVNLKAIHRELTADDLKAVCPGPGDPDCKAGIYAYVLLDRPRVIHLCPSYFRMPDMAEARAGRAGIEDGTREGTIIHELSHFPSVAATADERYGRTTCANMASGDPRRAIATADS